MLDRLRSGISNIGSSFGRFRRSERRIRIGAAPWVRKRQRGQWYFGRRTTINLVVFFAVAFLLIFLAATTLVLPKRGGRVISFDFVDAAGIQPRNDVTILGVPSGAVRDVILLPNGLAKVTAVLEPGHVVPQGTKAEINRRSPIGDLTLELHPGSGRILPDGAIIGPRFTTPPPDAERTIETLARVLHAVPSDKLHSLVTELAKAVRGRGRDLASLSVTTADFPEKLLRVKTELESLIRNGPKVTGVLATNAHSFANDIKFTARLADILRDRRFDLLELSKNGARFATVANDLIASQKSNLACFIADIGTVNVALAQHANTLAGAIALNHFFFGAVVDLVRPAVDGLDWFRVSLIPPGQPPARSYHRPPPGIYAGHACRSIYGPGVGRGGQPGPVWRATGSQFHPG